MRHFPIVLLVALIASGPASAERDRHRGFYQQGAGLGGLFLGFQPPVVMRPPPFVAPSSTAWFACDNPRGRYPQVRVCNQPWRKVLAQPPR